jgi:hypothetical protein
MGIEAINYNFHMMESIIQPEFFDPLICHIMHIRQADRYIEFTIPPNLLIDNDQVLLYFNEDVVMSFERGKPGVLRGTVKDKEVFSYIINKLKEL